MRRWRTDKLSVETGPRANNRMTVTAPERDFDAPQGRAATSSGAVST